MQIKPIRKLIPISSDTRNYTTWIPLKNKLPRPGELVWISDLNGVAIGCYTKDAIDGVEWLDLAGFTPEFKECRWDVRLKEASAMRPSHWMPLPSIPPATFGEVCFDPLCLNKWNSALYSLPSPFHLVWLRNATSIIIGCFAGYIKAGVAQWWEACSINFHRGQYDGDRDVAVLEPTHWMPLPYPQA